VRFGACDPAGIVYTPEYLNLFNGVVEDRYDEALGIFYHELVGKRGRALAMRICRLTSPGPAAWATCSMPRSLCIRSAVLALNAYLSRCENAADIVKSRWQEASSEDATHAAVT
jgi:hypothetical protein